MGVSDFFVINKIIMCIEMLSFVKSQVIVKIRMLKRHNQAKIIKKSVILFWLPNIYDHIMM